MRRNKKRNRIFLLIILLLGITIGFAALATTLKINGNATITKNIWSVYWEPTSVSVTQGSKGSTTPQVINGTDSSTNTKVTWSVNFELPGDFYEFTVDAANAGTLDAMITQITPTIPQDLPNYISYSITYADGVTPALNHLLSKGTKSGNTITPTTEKYKVRIEFKTTITPEQMNAIPDEGLSYDFGYEVKYGQADDNAIVKPQFILGDYFTLIPDETTATTDIAGFTGSTPTADQTLWRVIDIHNDGTVDAVSEYVSSNDIAIVGTDGYKNYAAGLQDIASKYAKTGYTMGTRVMGYDEQTLVIQNTSAFDGTLNPRDNPDVSPPSRTTTPVPTIGTGEEYSGGVLGDTLYLKDYQLVSNVYSNDTTTYSSTGLKAYDITGTAKIYWIASRRYHYTDDTFFYFGGRGVGANGSITSINFHYYNGITWSDFSRNYSIRPIITLNGDVIKNGGTGTKTDPYTFQ